MSQPKTPKTGRPHKFAGGSVVKTNISLSKDQHEWLKAQPQGVSGTIQNLVDMEMLNPHPLPDRQDC